MLIEPIWVLKRGLEHGYAEFRGPDGKFCKGNFVRGQREGKGEFKWADGRIYKGEWKTWKQYEFSIKAMQNSKLRFLHGSNGLSNKANEKNQVESSFHIWVLKNCLSNCMRRWIQSRIKKKSPLDSNLRVDLLFPF